MKRHLPALITGGAGFLGTHLARHLLELGYEVRSLDLKAPTYPVKGVKYTLGDCRHAPTLQRCTHDVGSIFHLAAITSVPVSQDNPYESYRTNFMMTCDVLEALIRESSRRKQKIRFAFAGSSVVYGYIGKKGIGIKENSALDMPLSFYGAQKFASEHAIRLYSAKFEIEAVIFRFFNLYGHGQDPSSPYSGVITRFQDLIRQGKPLSLHGGGSQTRDFIAVEDVARACAMVLKLPAKACDAKPINIGSGTTISIRRLAQTMNKVLRGRSPLINTPPRQGDVLHSKADILRAKMVLGWKPQIKLTEGLQRAFGNRQ